MVWVNLYFFAADHGALAHSTRYDRRVTRHSPTRRENRTGCDDSMKVLRGCFVPHQNYCVACCVMLVRAVGIENSFATCSARTRGQASAERLRLHRRIYDWMQK